MPQMGWDGSQERTQAADFSRRISPESKGSSRREGARRARSVDPFQAHCVLFYNVSPFGQVNGAVGGLRHTISDNRYLTLEAGALEVGSIL